MLNKNPFSILIGAAMLGVACAAHADVSGLIGNTCIEVGNNVEVRIKLHADGTFEKVSYPGGTSRGTWKEVEGKLCYVQTDPKPKPGAPVSFCAKNMDGRQVGDRWAERWPDGSVFRGHIVAGQK